ncbi:unnamed protein product [Arctogadus glacialis]
MTNEGGHPSTGSHSASSIRRLVGLFRGAEPSRGHSGGPDQSYEQRGRTAAKKTGPCLEGPSPHKGPPYRVQIGSTNGALRWVPLRGPITRRPARARVSVRWQGGALRSSSSWMLVALRFACRDLQCARQQVGLR